MPKAMSVFSYVLREALYRPESERLQSLAIAGSRLRVLEHVPTRASRHAKGDRHHSLALALGSTLNASTGGQAGSLRGPACKPLDGGSRLQFFETPHSEGLRGEPPMDQKAACSRWSANGPSIGGTSHAGSTR